jgi:hypothetical protein
MWDQRRHLLDDGVPDISNRDIAHRGWKPPLCRRRDLVPDKNAHQLRIIIPGYRDDAQPFERSFRHVELLGALQTQARP